MTINLCLIILLLSASCEAAVASIPVAVLAPEETSDSLVQRICAEASAIWASAGIAFEWHRLRSRDEEEEYAWPLQVTIDDRRTSLLPVGALGWLIFTPDGPGRSIHLSLVCAESLLRSTPELTNFTIATHEALVGRTLGRALAHELGHYLLRSKVHTPNGLMRAAWASGEFLSFRRDGFELTSEQRAAALRSFNSTQNPKALSNP